MNPTTTNFQSGNMRLPMFCPRTIFRLFFWCFLVMFAFGTDQSSHGQGNVSTPETTAGNPATKQEFRFSLVWSSKSGSYTYVPETWGELALNLDNLLDVPRELVCATYFDEQPNLQFGRQVWLPARSKLRVTHPLLVPKYPESKGRGINLHSLVIQNSSGNEILVKNESGQLLHESTMLITHTQRNTAMFAGSGISDQVPQDALDLVIAARIDQKLNNKVAVLSDLFLPAEETGLNCFDHLVIAENRIAEDFAAMSAVRHWLNSGGQLWIMLDRVEPRILEGLLGDDFTASTVDHVELTSVRVDKAPTLSEPNGAIGETVDYEEPVEMARVAVSNMDVWYTVNGWPAAMTKAYGDGRVLITTLGPRGWMQKRGPNDPKSNDPLFNSAFLPSPPMKSLASEIFPKRKPELITPTAIEPQVRSYVGYTVPTWGLVVGTLTCLLAFLIAVGIWLLRIDRIEHLGWIGSILAVAVSILLLMIGRSYRHGVPATIASVQVAQPITGTDEVQTQGMIAVYHPEGSQSAIQTSHGGRMLPDMTGLEGSVHRMVTTDLDAWHWENLEQSAGLRVSSFTKAETVIDRIEARATFDADGMVGKYSGRLPPGTDALVTTRRGRIGATLQPDGSFKASADDVLEKDQYLSASFLSDEQDRRRRTLEKLLNNAKRKDYPNRPQLMFWSDRWENGIQFGDNLNPQGATLMAVPLVIERPPIGTEIVIPPPMLPFRNRTNPNGSPTSGIWDDARGEWQERSAPTTTWLSFQVPRELVPLAASKARLDIEVSGPVGRIEILGLKNNEVTTLHSILDPVGKVTFQIQDADFLTISDDGRINLGLSAGDASRPELTNTKSSATGGSGKTAGAFDRDAKVNYWKIESLNLQLWARIPETNLKD